LTVAILEFIHSMQKSSVVDASLLHGMINH
jgi:hypothetical protein